MDLPSRVTQQWIERTVPLLEPDQVRPFLDALQRRGWSEVDLSERVDPVLAASGRRIPVPEQAGIRWRAPYIAQALSFAAHRPPKASQRRKEEVLENALSEFWTQWAHTTRSGQVQQQARMRLEHWPGIGPVDLEILVEQPVRSRCWIEVKWRDLGNCIWDVAKLALAVRQGLCDTAYLIAAAPTTAWRHRGPGAEFFTTNRWDTGHDILLAHRDAWLYWKTQVQTRPLLLPAVVNTHAEPHEPQVGGDFAGWTIRAAEVIPDPEEWIAVDHHRRPHRTLSAGADR